MPLWFGPEHRRLFGWVHRPVGPPRGTVVLCPPFGLEGVAAHRSFRACAGRMAAAGWVAVRFDYDGTGDSVGDDGDPDRVEAWTASVLEAVRLARRVAPGPTTVVGMRLGATIAAVAASRLVEAHPLAGLVLWDPCASGRSYLREQQALRFFSLGQHQRDDGAVEAPGVLFRPDTVGALRALALPRCDGPLAERVLVLPRAGRTPSRGLVEVFDGHDVEWSVAEGQEDLVDVEPFAAQVPVRTTEAVVSWLDRTPAPPPTAARAAGGAETPAGTGTRIPGTATSAVVAHSAAGTSVSERPVRLGPLGIFGVMTETDGGSPAPTVVLLNSGVIDHTGPSRLWVDLARRWAASGLRVVRCDLSGLGDSPTRAGQPVDVMYPPEAFDDLDAVCRAVSPADPTDVVLVGLCSGGYHSVEAAISSGARGVIAINPIMTAKPSEIVSDAGGAEPMSPRRQASAARRRWARALPAHDFLGGIVDRLPDATWWLINRVAVEHPPIRALRRTVDAGVDILVVCGEREARVIRRGERRAFGRLERSPLFHLEVLEGIDHELFAESARSRVVPILSEHLTRRFAGRWAGDGPTRSDTPPGAPAAGRGPGRQVS